MRSTRALPSMTCPARAWRMIRSSTGLGHRRELLALTVPTVMALDPSGGGADEFAWCVCKAWGGNFTSVRSAASSAVSPMSSGSSSR